MAKIWNWLKWECHALNFESSVSLLSTALKPGASFKLAAYTLLVQGDNGSMGDIACIAYQTLVAYTSFDRQQVSQWLSDMPLRDLLAKDWGIRFRLLNQLCRVTFWLAGLRFPLFLVR